jgi:uncharacterized protein YjiS (DUF1127 family)
MASIHSGSIKRAPSRSSVSWLNSAGSFLGAAAREFLGRWARARRFRRDVEILSDLDDDQLKDIGLSRDQIEEAAAARAGSSW